MLHLQNILQRAQAAAGVDFLEKSLKLQLPGSE